MMFRSEKNPLFNKELEKHAFFKEEKFKKLVFIDLFFSKMAKSLLIIFNEIFSRPYFIECQND